MSEDELNRKYVKSYQKPDPTKPRTCEVCGYVEPEYASEEFAQLTKEYEAAQEKAKAAATPIEKRSAMELAYGTPADIKASVLYERLRKCNWSIWANRLICPHCTYYRGDGEKMVMVMDRTKEEGPKK